MRRYTFISLLIATSTMFSLMVVDMFGGGMVGWSQLNMLPRPSDTLIIDTKIREQVAITTTTQVFRSGSTTPSTAAYGFRLPAGAMVTSFRWCVNGTWFTASLQASDTTLPANGGTATMDQFARYFGETPFVFRFTDTFAVNVPIKTELTYVEVLSLTKGQIEYTYPYRALGTSTQLPLTKWDIDVLAERDVLSPTLIGLIAAEQGIEARHVRYHMTSQLLQEATVGFRYSLQYDGLTMSVLSTKPAGEDGYALMMAVPESDIKIEEVLPKRFTFVIDRSGSMQQGQKMAQARQAAEYCVQRLNPDDLLSVVQFSSYVLAWGDPHLPATPTNIHSATNYIRAIQPDGGTDIMMALRSALERHVNDDYVNVIIFLTDGQAPIDHATLATYNTSATRIFVFGIGEGVNETDLRKIAEDHKGSYHFVTDPAMTVANVSELFDKINDPLIKNPKVVFSPDVVYDVYPSVVPDVYVGEQLMLVGRYTTPGDVTVSVSGSNREGAVQHQFAAHLTDDPNIHTFVGKIWAKYRIAMLTDMMKKEAVGSSNWKEWRDEIIRLGRQFSIVTPFTSFVDGGQTDPGDDAGDETDDGNGTVSTVEHDEIIVARDRCSVSPNPVSTSAHISIDLADMDRSKVRVEIVDLSGRLIAVLFDDVTAPEHLDLEWNVMDQAGVMVPSGAYVLSVTVNGVRSTTTISVVR